MKSTISSVRYFCCLFCAFFVLVIGILNAQAVCIDNDGDGYGSPGDVSCPKGSKTDCNDADPAVNPGAAEICDGKDTNCDGYRTATDVDKDKDGYAVCANDCNDNDPNVHPGATELCNGKDDDCNYVIPSPEKDADKDGVKICDVPSDCNDFDSGIYPGSIEICGDKKDNNCNGSVDETGCVCPDADGDGHTASICGGDDCNDADPAVFSGNTEICSDGKDNNCNGSADCQDPTCTADPVCVACLTADTDGDGYSTAGGICGLVDCDDADPKVHPGAAEICDGKDSN